MNEADKDLPYIEYDPKDGPPSPSKLILKSESPLAVYSEFRQQLEQLKEDNKTVVFNYETPEGSKEARSHIYTLRKTKGAVDKARKAEKAESLRYGRLVDSEAKELVSEIDTMIEVHAAPLREIDEREAERIEQHKDHIEGMHQVSGQTERQDGTPLNSEELREAYSYVSGIDFLTFEEFAEQAAEVREQALHILTRRINERKQYEEEQAELVRLRREAEAREAREAEERKKREKADREERIRKEGEARARQEAEEKAARERQEAEAREQAAQLEIETAQREKAEAKQAAAEAEQRAAQAEKEAKLAAEQAVRDKVAQEAAAAAKRESNKRHRAKFNNEALDCLVAGGIDTDVARSCVTLIAEGKVRHVKITY